MLRCEDEAARVAVPGRGAVGVFYTTPVWKDERVGSRGGHPDLLWDQEWPRHLSLPGAPRPGLAGGQPAGTPLSPGPRSTTPAGV